MTYSFSSLVFLGSWALSIFPASLCGDDPCFFCFAVFYWSERCVLTVLQNVKAGLEAASHVCFGRITCLVLWDVCSLPTYSHNTCGWCNCSQCHCVKASYECQGTQLTMLHISVTSLHASACDCFIKKNCSDVLCMASASDGTPTDRPINHCSSLLVDCLMHIAHKSTFWLGKL